VRIRNIEIVQLLLDKKAKVSASDKKGDTALHVAMRARSKVMICVLLIIKLSKNKNYRDYNISILHTNYSKICS
jgi:ankyrin repeat protein